TPAVKEPADPKAETQSWQLTCSLTPSSTEPSTWLVIIWLNRWLATPLMELPLVPPSFSVGVGDGVGVGVGQGGSPSNGLPHGAGQGGPSSPHATPAAAGCVCAASAKKDSV